MRVIVFFDLPTLTLEDKKEYRNFRKFLLKRGFAMMQESVYSKLALNTTVASVKEHKPKDGLVQMLVITEKQYSKMEYVVGEKGSTIIDSDQRTIIL